jgi:hypothetical protein
MKESIHKPDGRSPPAGVDFFDTFPEALEELRRRIMILGQAPYLFNGLALRVAADGAVTIHEEATTNPRFSNHVAYAAQIDVFETDDGIHVSVDESFETPALRAELGTRTMRLQALWGPRYRRDVALADRFGEELAEIIARKAETGHALENDDLDPVLQDRALLAPAEMTVLKDMADERQRLMAKEEA